MRASSNGCQWPVASTSIMAARNQRMQTTAVQPHCIVQGRVRVVGTPPLIQEFAAEPTNPKNTVYSTAKMSAPSGMRHACSFRSHTSNACVTLCDAHFVLSIPLCRPAPLPNRCPTASPMRAPEPSKPHHAPALKTLPKASKRSLASTHTLM